MLEQRINDFIRKSLDTICQLRKEKKGKVFSESQCSGDFQIRGIKRDLAQLDQLKNGQISNILIEVVFEDILHEQWIFSLERKPQQQQQSQQQMRQNKKQINNEKTLYKQLSHCLRSITHLLYVLPMGNCDNLFSFEKYSKKLSFKMFLNNFSKDIKNWNDHLKYLNRLDILDIQCSDYLQLNVSVNYLNKLILPSFKDQFLLMQNNDHIQECQLNSPDLLFMEKSSLNTNHTTNELVTHSSPYPGPLFTTLWREENKESKKQQQHQTQTYDEIEEEEIEYQRRVDQTELNKQYELTEKALHEEKGGFEEFCQRDDLLVNDGDNKIDNILEEIEKIKKQTKLQNPVNTTNHKKVKLLHEINVLDDFSQNVHEFFRKKIDI